MPAEPWGSCGSRVLSDLDRHERNFSDLMERMLESDKTIRELLADQREYMAGVIARLTASSERLETGQQELRGEVSALTERVRPIELGQGRAIGRARGVHAAGELAVKWVAIIVAVAAVAVAVIK